MAAISADAWARLARETGLSFVRGFGGLRGKYRGFSTYISLAKEIELRHPRTDWLPANLHFLDEAIIEGEGAAHLNQDLREQVTCVAQLGERLRIEGRVLRCTFRDSAWSEQLILMHLETVLQLAEALAGREGGPYRR